MILIISSCILKARHRQIIRKCTAATTRTSHLRLRERHHYGVTLVRKNNQLIWIFRNPVQLPITFRILSSSCWIPQSTSELCHRLVMQSHVQARVAPPSIKCYKRKFICKQRSVQALIQAVFVFKINYCFMFPHKKGAIKVV